MLSARSGQRGPRKEPATPFLCAGDRVLAASTSPQTPKEPAALPYTGGGIVASGDRALARHDPGHLNQREPGVGDPGNSLLRPATSPTCLNVHAADGGVASFPLCGRSRALRDSGRTQPRGARGSSLSPGGSRRPHIGATRLIETGFPCLARTTNFSRAAPGDPATARRDPARAPPPRCAVKITQPQGGGKQTNTTLELGKADPQKLVSRLGLTFLAIAAPGDRATARRDPV
ncbi:hypothetical protein NDU88_001018 [Pleurodeles waltl]|uniref:Uncharacterized protein n=1 Tax=Pleurodeles waltl TaxID=8319 RepID=A0AAV7KQY9_PLEWA|nr:hypothetical protein NDU88_001018 [Pleurodeles waltl]